MRIFGRVKNSLAILFFSILATACSVVPKEQAKLTGVTELGVWREGLADAKAAHASRAEYNEARARVNALISPRLELEVDRVAGQSLFGVGGAVDFSKEKIIDGETATAVQEFYASKRRAFGSGGLAMAAGTAALQYAEAAAREARQSSATSLKRQLNSYKWPAWSEVK